MANFEGHYSSTKAFLLLAEKYSRYTGFNINKYFEIDEIKYPLVHIAVCGMIFGKLNFLPSQYVHSRIHLNVTNRCKYEHLEIIQLLFEHSIDVNIQDKNSITCISYFINGYA